MIFTLVKIKFRFTVYFYINRFLLLSFEVGKSTILLFPLSLTNLELTILFFR